MDWRNNRVLDKLVRRIRRGPRTVLSGPGNKTYASMTDAKGSQLTKMMNFDMAKLTVLAGNFAHNYEHYGNMVTYMRIRGIVPPTSEKGGSPAQN